MARSGYFHLSDKQPEQFVAQKAAHNAFNLVLHQHMGLGNHFLWQGREGTEAAISACMPYTHTMLLHQMTKIEGVGENRTVLRELLTRGFEYCRQRPHVHWTGGLLNSKVKFNEYAFVQFSAPYIPHGKAMVLPFRLVEINCESSSTLPPGLHLVEPSPEDRLALCR